MRRFEMIGDDIRAMDNEFGMRVARRHFFDGQSAGLTEKTAVAEVLISGHPVFDVDALDRLRAAALALCPEQPLHGVDKSDWPTTFLAPSPQICQSDETTLAGWAVALTVAIQRYGRDAAWQGKVVVAEPGRLVLALPWQRRGFLDDALGLALTLLQDALQPPDKTIPQALSQWLGPVRTATPLRLADHYDELWSPILETGLAPDTLRIIEAAVSRRIPVDVLPSFVQLGWGINAVRVDRTCTDRTPRLGCALVRNESQLLQTLTDHKIPVPTEPRINDTSHTHRLLMVKGQCLSSIRVPQDRPAHDCTGVVHPENRGLALRVARIVGLDIAEIDFRTVDITKSWRNVGGVVCAVRAQPNLESHRAADPDRDIDAEIVDVLLAGRSARIPTAAITGTNGKTTTAEMLFNIWMAAGKLTGVCTTHTLRIGREVASTKNLSGQPGARRILNDPAVEAAVFEMPRKGLFRFGHPCDRYDVAAFLNLQDDHIGADGIDSMEQMAELKAGVIERARHAVILNADDPLCLAMRPRAGTDRHILVTRQVKANPIVVEHLQRNGEAVFLTNRHDDQRIVLAKGDRHEDLMCIDEIPATMAGLLRVNIDNAMYAAALAWAQGLDPKVIRKGLASFHNSSEQNPGRYNFIDGLPFQLLQDFAHNPDGVRELCSVAAQLRVSGRRIICTRNLGNRHARHVAAVAAPLAATFDEFVLSCDPAYAAECPDYAGDDPAGTMLSMTQQYLAAAGADSAQITTIVDPDDAIPHALKLAGPGDLVVLLAEPSDATASVTAYLATKS